MMNKTCCALFILLFAIFQHVHGQKLVSGVIRDSLSKEPLSGVHVVVWDATKQRVQSTAYSVAGGSYSVFVPDSGSFELRFSLLGYKRRSVRVEPATLSLGGLDVSLITETFRMEEVVINVRPKLVRAGDTVRFFADSYTRGDEQVLQDLLSRLPGFQVLTDGTVKVGQQEIDRILIEGDDLFDKGYHLLSTNMPVYPINQVEVLKNYSHNKLLHGVEESDKIALNLTLKEDYQSIWFGQIHAGGGHADGVVYELRPHIMNFGKWSKMYAMSDANKTGRWSMDLQQQKEGRERGSPQHPTSLHEFYTMDNAIQNDEPSRSRGKFGHSGSASFNAVFNPAPAWKLNARALFSRDVIQRQWTVEELVGLPDLNFKREEAYTQRITPLLGYLEWDVSYDMSPRQTFQWTSSLHSGIKKLSHAYVSDLLSGKEDKRRHFRTSDQQLHYTNKLSNKSVLIADLQATHGVGPQHFIHAQDAVHVHQLADHRLSGYQVGVHYMYRITEKHLLDWKSRYLDQDDLFFIHRVEPDERGLPILRESDSSSYLFESRLWYSRVAYHGNAGRFAWVGGASIHQTRRMDKGQQAPLLSAEHDWQVNPELRGMWSFNAHHRLGISYALSSASRQVVDMIPDYVQTGFRTAYRGLRTPGLSKTSTWTMNHYVGNWLDGVFVHTLAYLMHFHKIGQSSIRVDPDFTWVESMWAHDPYLFSIQTTGDYFISGISSNLQVELSHGRSLRKSRVNSPALHNYFSRSYGSALRLRSGWSGFINFHVGWKYSHSRLNTPSDTDRTQSEHHLFSDIFVKNSRNNWHMGLKWEWYFLDQTDFESATLGFLDFESKWEMNPNKWFIYLVGENLNGLKESAQFRIRDDGYIKQFDRLLPPSLIFRLEYRF